MGRTGVLHGARSSLLSDEDGQILDAHSSAPGLDYPGVGPEHAHPRDTGRAEYVSVEDAAALEAFRRLARTEGIIPALEPAHALAHVSKLEEELIVLCLSDCDPAGWQMPISIGRKMQALRTLEFPELAVQVRRVALRPAQVRAEGLPESPPKENARPAVCQFRPRNAAAGPRPAQADARAVGILGMM